MMMFALAMLLPDEVELELQKLRESFRQFMTYIPISHITLVYPFASAGLTAEVLEKLDAIAVSTPPIQKVLEGVRFFDSTRVAYLGIGDTQPIVSLRKAVLGCL